MIGFIAGAGIVVRNSIILVDFIELRVRDGMSLEDAVVDAGAVRFRPMALTAAAVIVGLGGDPLRSDLPGPGDLADGRRSGVAAAFARNRAHHLLPVAPRRRTRQRSDIMRLEPMLRLIAGTFVAASVLLALTVHPYFFALTLFVAPT